MGIGITVGICFFGGVIVVGVMFVKQGGMDGDMNPFNAGAPRAGAAVNTGITPAEGVPAQLPPYVTVV